MNHFIYKQLDDLGAPTFYETSIWAPEPLNWENRLGIRSL